MDSFLDYYAGLGVAPAASRQEISRAYRALMRTHHPTSTAARQRAARPRIERPRKSSYLDTLRNDAFRKAMAHAKDFLPGSQ